MSFVNPSHMAHFIKGTAVANYEDPSMFLPEPDKPATRWDSRSDATLRYAVEVVNPRDWDKIANFFESRSAEDCRRRWKALSPPLIKGAWSSAEDEILRHHVLVLKTTRWSVIANALPGRNGKQCRERWHNHLKPDINKEDWRADEDEIVVKAHSELGNKWTEIARRLKGRTDNQVKNRWNSTLYKRQQRQIADQVGGGSLSAAAATPAALASSSSVAVGAASAASSDVASTGKRPAEAISAESAMPVSAGEGSSASPAVSHDSPATVNLKAAGTTSAKQGQGKELLGVVVPATGKGTRTVGHNKEERSRFSQLFQRSMLLGQRSGPALSKATVENNLKKRRLGEGGSSTGDTHSTAVPAPGSVPHPGHPYTPPTGSTILSLSPSVPQLATPPVQARESALATPTDTPPSAVPVPEEGQQDSTAERASLPGRNDGSLVRTPPTTQPLLSLADPSRHKGKQSAGGGRVGVGATQSKLRAGPGGAEGESGGDDYSSQLVLSLVAARRIPLPATLPPLIPILPQTPDRTPRNSDLPSIPAFPIHWFASVGQPSPLVKPT